MKSSVLLLILVGTSASGASAQGALAVQRVPDAGMASQSCAACTLRFDSGIAFESRTGIRGMPTVGRQHNLDNLDNLDYLDYLDYLAPTGAGAPFKGGMAGSAANLVADRSRNGGNSVQYYRRQLHAVFAAASYKAGASAGERASSRAWGISVGVERGAMILRLAHQNRNLDAVAPASAMGNQLEAKNTIVAANLRLGQGAAYAAYSANRGWGSSPLWNPDNPYGAAMASTPSTDSRDVLVGLALPVGATTWLASFIRKNDRDLANRDADQLAIGATYALSQRTDFYAAYSRITNRHGAGYTAGNASAPGSGSAALNLGMRHAF